MQFAEVGDKKNTRKFDVCINWTMSRISRRIFRRGFIYRLKKTFCETSGRECSPICVMPYCGPIRLLQSRFLERSLLASDLWNRYDLHDARSKWHLLIDTSVFDISYDSAEIIRENVISFRLSRERFFSEFFSDFAIIAGGRKRDGV